MELSGLHQAVRSCVKNSLQSNCTPRAQLPWGQPAALPGRAQRDMMWPSLRTGTGNLSHYQMPTGPALSSRRSPGGTSPYNTGCTRKRLLRLPCLLVRAGTAWTGSKRHPGKTWQTGTARTAAATSLPQLLCPQGSLWLLMSLRAQQQGAFAWCSTAHVCGEADTEEQWVPSSCCAVTAQKQAAEYPCSPRHAGHLSGLPSPPLPSQQRGLQALSASCPEATAWQGCCGLSRHLESSWDEANARKLLQQAWYHDTSTATGGLL